MVLRGPSEWLVKIVVGIAHRVEVSKLSWRPVEDVHGLRRLEEDHDDVARDERVAEAVEVAPDVASWLAGEEVLVLVEGRDAHPGESNLIETHEHLPAHKGLLLLDEHGDRQVRIEECVDVVAVFGVLHVFRTSLRARVANVLRSWLRVVLFIFFLVLFLINKWRCDDILFGYVLGLWVLVAGLVGGADLAAIAT